IVPELPMVGGRPQMDKSQIPVLAEVLELYYTEEEMLEMAGIFDVTFPEETVGRFPRFNWLSVARQLVERIDHGNHYQMLEATLTALEQRNRTAIARTDWERRESTSVRKSEDREIARGPARAWCCPRNCRRRRRTLHGQVGDSRISGTS